MNRIAKLSQIRERIGAASAEADHASRRQSRSLDGPQEFDDLAADPFVDRSPRRREADQSRLLSIFDELNQEEHGK